MINKEERILIKTYTPICNYFKCETTEYHDGYVDEEEICSLTHEKCEPKNCKNKVFSGMTRQEAIEKIKNASEFYLSHKLGCTKEEEAECILNALLGVKNGR